MKLALVAIMVVFFGCAEPPEKEREIFFQYGLEGTSFRSSEFSVLYANNWQASLGSKTIALNDSLDFMTVTGSLYSDTNSIRCDFYYEAEIQNFTINDGELTLADPYPRDEGEVVSEVQSIYKRVLIDTNSTVFEPVGCDYFPQFDSVWHFELYQNGDLIVTDFGRNVEYLLLAQGPPREREL